MDTDCQTILANTHTGHWWLQVWDCATDRAFTGTVWSTAGQKQRQQTLCRSRRSNLMSALHARSTCYSMRT